MDYNGHKIPVKPRIFDEQVLSGPPKNVGLLALGICHAGRSPRLRDTNDPTWGL